MDKVIIDRLNAANIPMTVHDTLLDSVTGGKPFKDYVATGNYKIDKAGGMGLCVYGDPPIRVKIFPLLARAMVIASDDVFYTQTIVLRDIACCDQERGHPLLEKAMSCGALFISNFYGRGESAPYSSMERAVIEQFLLARSYQKKRNYFSSHESLRMCEWWSTDFLEDQLQFMRDVQV